MLELRSWLVALFFEFVDPSALITGFMFSKYSSSIFAGTSIRPDFAHDRASLTSLKAAVTFVGLTPLACWLTRDEVAVDEVELGIQARTCSPRRILPIVTRARCLGGPSAAMSGVAPVASLDSLVVDAPVVPSPTPTLGAAALVATPTRQSSSPSDTEELYDGVATCATKVVDRVGRETRRARRVACTVCGNFAPSV